MPNISKAQIEQTSLAITTGKDVHGVLDMLQGLLAQPEQLSKDALIDIIYQHTALTYHCTRTWQAWGVGTMTQDDFEEVNESGLPDELADAILAKITTHPAPFAPITADMAQQFENAMPEGHGWWADRDVSTIIEKAVQVYMGAKK